MVGLMNTVKDSVGTIWLRNFQVTGAYESTARINRQKLLDGGVSLTNLGQSDLDADFKVDCRLSEAEAEKMRAWHSGGAELVISFWRGAYTGFIYNLNVQRDGLAKITFYFKETLS
jgi:hypothetical protein